MKWWHFVRYILLKTGVQKKRKPLILTTYCQLSDTLLIILTNHLTDERYLKYFVISLKELHSTQLSRPSLKPRNNVVLPEIYKVSFGLTLYCFYMDHVWRVYGVSPDSNGFHKISSVYMKIPVIFQ